jgi:hypothetical protein
VEHGTRLKASSCPSVVRTNQIDFTGLIDIDYLEIEIDSKQYIKNSSLR